MGRLAEVENKGPHQRLTREESRARTRQRLLAAAAEVFAERGIHGATVEEIAERAGFTRGAFYSNFGAKEDLIVALLDERVDADIRAMEEAMAADPSPQAFFEFLRSRTGRRSEEAKTWTLLSAEFWLHVLRHPELAPTLAARQRAGRAALARVIETLCAQLGITLPTAAEELASVMLAVDDGLVLQEALDPDAVPEDLRLRTLVLFVQGLAALSPPASDGSPPGPRG